MKVLVYQVKIGKKSFCDSFVAGRDFETYHSFEQQYLIPSVKRWAEKCGYDYKMYELEEHTLPSDNGFFSGDLNPLGYILCQRIEYISQEEYDYVIYVDCDVYVKENAPQFPIRDGFSVIAEYPVVQEAARNNFRMNINYEYDSEYQYFNSGVFGVDRETGKNIREYFIKRFNSGESYYMFDSLWCLDQALFNQYCIENPVSLHYISPQWNSVLWEFMESEFPLKDQKIHQSISETYFCHFAAECKNDYKHIYDKIKD